MTAVTNGTATITASSGSASATATVTVMQSAGRIVLEPSSATLMSLGKTVQLTASVLDANGQAVEDAAIAWSSSDEGVATVSGQGLVTAVTNGTATITARSGSASATATVTVMENSRDREALIALYNSTDGPNWRVSTNWLSDRPLGEWFGVSTDAAGRVTQLRLAILDSNTRQLTTNGLSGSIPPELGNLSNLQRLDIIGAELTGSIPSELGNLSNLQRLRISYSELSGSIPPEIGRLHNLTSLGLVGNEFTGPIISEIANLRNLRYLSLSHNRLTGTIPVELAQLRNLRDLRLDSNQLSGPIPPEIANLQNLRYLDIGNNFGLTGPLPAGFLNLGLDHFYLSRTSLCVPFTTVFRQWFDSIPNSTTSGFCPDPERDPLIALYRSTDGANWTVSTNWSSDEPLGAWHGVKTDTDGRVSELSLGENNLIGLIPSQVGDLVSLVSLDLSGNAALSGILPRSFIKLSLQNLNLNGTGVCIPTDTEFTQWLERIRFFTGSVCTENRPDHNGLIELYASTNGPGWKYSNNWLSERPLSEWYGVSTDSNGRVVSLDLTDNNLQGLMPSGIAQLQNLRVLYLGGNGLTGPIPTELGRLQKLTKLGLDRNRLTGLITPGIAQLQNLDFLNLGGNGLTGPIPAEFGRLQNLRTLVLEGNELTGAIPVELAQLRNLFYLHLGYNNWLTGAIPAELAQLQKLQSLHFSGNSLTGTIPVELARLQNLRILHLGINKLTGIIPAELGQLQNLEILVLDSNELTGSIPAELGRLRNLSGLWLYSNELTGSIPAELGRLQNLDILHFGGNGLTGSIPTELGRLQNLRILVLENNDLTGTIPVELGRLQSLENLNLIHNKLTGNVPSTFGDLANLKELNLTGNTTMSGALPLALVGLNLESLGLGTTGLCAPKDPTFQAWLKMIPASFVENCVSVVGRSAAYLTQAVQSLKHPVPLVAGEEALLRVFVTTQAGEEVPMPDVKAVFYMDGAEVQTVDIPGGGISVPQHLDEGDLSASATAMVPGSIVMPGLEIVVNIDPVGALDPALGVRSRIPPTGRLPVEVRYLPPFDLTLVPFLYTDFPDRSVVTETEHLTAESDLFRLTRNILPVREFHLTVREPVWTSFDPIGENMGLLLRETQMVRTMDGATGNYMGILRDGGAGRANLPGPVSVSGLGGGLMAHELGHNMNLRHAPCGGADGPDPNYPNPDGSIGAWGYDLLKGTLVSPDTPDLMSYCGPRWISDYHFTKALNYRVLQAQNMSSASLYTSSPSARNLLLWGGVNERGELVLEPAFAVDAPAALPDLDGPYLIEGEARDGGVLFRLSFGMPEISHGEGGVFAFILPARSDWPDRLARITLSGPEGVATLGGEEELDDWDAPAAALLLDPVTGSVRGLLRDWPDQGVSEPGVSAAAVRSAAARWAAPEPGLEVLISRGIPEFEDWER